MFFKDLGALSWKCNYQGMCAPLYQSLWDGIYLTSVGSDQGCKTTSCHKDKRKFNFWGGVNSISKQRCPKILGPKISPTIFFFFSGIKVNLSPCCNSLE